MKKSTLIISIIVIIVLAAAIIAGIIFMNEKNKSDNKSNESSSINGTVNEKKFEYQSENQAKAMFNAFFDVYKDSYANSIRVKQLLTIIKSQNEKNQDHKVEAVINGESTFSSSKITDTHTYKVSFEYDKDGYITKAIINEN